MKNTFCFNIKSLDYAHLHHDFILLKNALHTTLLLNYPTPHLHWQSKPQNCWHQLTNKHKTSSAYYGSNWTRNNWTVFVGYCGRILALEKNQTNLKSCHILFLDFPEENCVSPNMRPENNCGSSWSYWVTISNRIPKTQASRQIP